MAKSGRALPVLGMVGIGGLGAAIAQRLLKMKYSVIVFDTNVSRVKELARAGARAAASAADVGAEAEIILTALPNSEMFVQVVENELLPGLTKGKVLIDLGITELSQTRRLAAWLNERGVHLLDAPVSGSERRAEEGSLNIFVGGSKDVYKACSSLLKCLGAAGKITYCGPSGCGQIVKGVEQLAVGLGQAAFIEAIAYGVNHGISAEDLAETLEDSAASRTTFASVIKQILSEGGENVSTNAGELGYFVKSSDAIDQPLPLTTALATWMHTAEPVVIERGEHTPSYWIELTRRPKKDSRDADEAADEEKTVISKR
ncbi:MAG TPA: NAD(P)-dependent oxidoreductase [Planctomycetota bacterium]|nr:NAD(P)-dependent oxidoreductase [Planctomycetota bacterium]